MTSFIIMELYAVKNQNLIHDKVAAKKRYKNLIIDNASIEDIMLFYIKGGVK